MINLSDVKTYLINYFGNNPFDYSKYQETNTNNNDLPYILSGSCTTSNIKLQLSDTENIINDDGSITIIYSDGTRVTTYPDGTTVTILPDGTKITKYPDNTVKTEYPDGTVITEYKDSTREIEYTNGLHIIEDSDGNIISIKDSDGEMIDFTTLEPIFSKFRGMDHTSETIRYLLDVYKLYYRDELKKYKMEEYDSYLMEYITAKSYMIQIIQNITQYKNQNYIIIFLMYWMIFKKHNITVLTVKLTVE